jgi:hypothetical protein
MFGFNRNSAMENLPKSNADRREFFRITDSILINYSPLNTDEMERLIPNIYNHTHNDGSQDNQRLQSVQTNLNHLIDTINQTDRDIARALRLLDEKINLITNSISQNNLSKDKRPYTDANLSAGGIAFYVSEHYPAKSAMQVNLELHSSGNIIHAIAHVVECSKQNDAPQHTPYQLRLVFSHMHETDRNLLVKHTLSRQALDLRINKRKPFST